MNVLVMDTPLFDVVRLRRQIMENVDRIQTRQAMNSPAGKARRPAVEAAAGAAGPLRGGRSGRGPGLDWIADEPAAMPPAWRQTAGAVCTGSSCRGS
jgi:hypothetical protein